MMFFNALLFIMVFFTSNALLASSGAGNGGDALVCENSPDYGNKVILLDFHEARKRGLTVNLSNPLIETQTHRTMINVAVARLMEKDIATATKLYNYATEMVNDLEMLQMYPGARGKVLYIGNDVVGNINDSLHVTLPIGCKIKQLVSQKVPKYRLDFRYEMNKSIWDQMDLTQQSMTILHEAWYRIMIENDDKPNHNSYGARYLNGLIASEEFDSYSFSEYIEDLKETEMKSYEVLNSSSVIIGDSVAVPLKGLQFSLDQENVCVSDFHVPTQLKTFGVRGVFNGIKTLNIKYIQFCFKNSRPVSLKIPKEVTEKGFLVSMDLHQVSVKSASLENAVIKFHPNGKLDHLTNIEIEFLLKMFYKCGESEVFERKPGCKGPYRYNDSKILNPGPIFFSSEDESPIGFYL